MKGRKQVIICGLIKSILCISCSLYIMPILKRDGRREYQDPLSIREDQKSISKEQISNDSK